MLFPTSFCLYTILLAFYLMHYIEAIDANVDNKECKFFTRMNSASSVRACVRENMYYFVANGVHPRPDMDYPHNELYVVTRCYFLRGS